MLRFMCLRDSGVVAPSAAYCSLPTTIKVLYHTIIVVKMMEDEKLQAGLPNRPEALIAAIAWLWRKTMSLR